MNNKILIIPVLALFISGCNPPEQQSSKDTSGARVYIHNILVDPNYTIYIYDEINLVCTHWQSTQSDKICQAITLVPKETMKILRDRAK